MSVRTLSLGALAAVLVAVVALLFFGGGGQDREIRARFTSAVNLVPGASVRVGGVVAGSVAAIDLDDGDALVTLHLDERAPWPLREGTRARIRFGGTVSYSNRYVAVEPGPQGGAPLGDGAELPTADALTPVEFDELWNAFDPSTREGLGDLVDAGAATLGSRGARLRSGTAAVAPALDEAAEVLGDLGADPRALRTLVASGAAVAGNLARREDDLRVLVDGARDTFAAVADGERATRATLRALPATLQDVRGTLRRAQPSLRALDGLVGDLAPGARTTRVLAPTARRAVATLGEVAPELRRTLTAVGAAAPATTAFLREARPVLERTAPVLDDLVPMLACLRPYAPEIAGFIPNWAGISTGYDATGRFARGNYQAFPFPNDVPFGSARALQLDPGLDYALIRPPGYQARNSTFLPECGVTPDGIDATKDPESR